MPVPQMEDWRAIAAGFQERWNFPNCFGAIDWKHVVIQAPANSGSLYFNYKSTHSLVLLAVVDAQYLFRVVDVGGFGRSSDSGSLLNSAFGESLRDGSLQLPPDTVIPGAERLGLLPHVFVGDEAFPLLDNLLHPFPGRHLTRERKMFNYCLSRARLVVECAFGILSSQWGMFRRVITTSPEVAELCVKAVCVLHNFLRRKTIGKQSCTPIAEYTDEATHTLHCQNALSNLRPNVLDISMLTLKTSKFACQCTEKDSDQRRVSAAEKDSDQRRVSVAEKDSDQRRVSAAEKDSDQLRVSAAEKDSDQRRRFS
ncbi:hypothetical protein JOQ06_012226 [Pogonophryne albipinna]|uniref:DDE Tnp4 domain-containing protein n=1 Tax=Pogonophryne albipinna TaxID=1090488 RepID=A0AAD6BF27_9TELE|nr:hypothetical protein JOQ06_012226 [Pogonophryne albipinna]